MNIVSQEGQESLQPHHNEQAEKAIQVLVIPSDEEPYLLQNVENRPDALRELIGGEPITCEVVIEGAIGLAHIKGEALDLPFNRAATAASLTVYGDLLIVGMAASPCSLSPLQLEQALLLFAPTLPLKVFEQIILSHPQGPEWVANWEPPDI